jgi:dolichyl-phosphate-mannose-protein mannosyltransferase
MEFALARYAIIAIISAGSVALLFARLGHYSLWDDEALTALHAKAVWRSGDTGAVIGPNIVGYRGGRLLHNLHERFTPPLPSYLAAIPVGLSGGTAWAARLPFALCGLACVALIQWWAWRERIHLTTWALLGMAILGNVSFFLYFRQCRYYGPAILLSVALTYLYLHWDSRRWSLVAFALLAACLFATNYMNYAALAACLWFDYMLWGRERHRLRSTDWLWLGASQVVLCGPVFWIWYPLDKPIADYLPGDWLTDRVALLWRNVRDLSRCEFGVAMLLLAAPILHRWVRRDWLVRAPLALGLYVAVVTLISPQPVQVTEVADVRYLVPIIPLCMAIGVLSLDAISLKSRRLALGLGVIAFGTSLLPGGRQWGPGQGSTIAEYIRELLQPPGDPYSVAARWINAHVAPGRSVLVLPDFMTYPLMYHAPHAVYAWQFADPPQPQFQGLPPIQFTGQVPPDYIVAFGRFAMDHESRLSADLKSQYHQISTPNFLCRDLYRPELFLRTFRPVPESAYDKNTDLIYIYSKKGTAGLREIPVAVRSGSDRPRGEVAGIGVCRIPLGTGPAAREEGIASPGDWPESTISDRAGLRDRRYDSRASPRPACGQRGRACGEPMCEGGSGRDRWRGSAGLGPMARYSRFADFGRKSEVVRCTPNTTCA